MGNLVSMAGRGKRFTEQGYKLPKPLIPVMNQPIHVIPQPHVPPTQTATTASIATVTKCVSPAGASRVRSRVQRVTPATKAPIPVIPQPHVPPIQTVTTTYFAMATKPAWLTSVSPVRSRVQRLRPATNKTTHARQPIRRLG